MGRYVVIPMARICCHQKNYPSKLLAWKITRGRDMASTAPQFLLICARNWGGDSLLCTLGNYILCNVSILKHECFSLISFHKQCYPLSFDIENFIQNLHIYVESSCYKHNYLRKIPYYNHQWKWKHSTIPILSSA